MGSWRNLVYLRFEPDVANQHFSRRGNLRRDSNSISGRQSNRLVYTTDVGAKYEHAITFTIGYSRQRF